MRAPSAVWGQLQGFLQGEKGVGGTAFHPAQKCAAVEYRCVQIRKRCLWALGLCRAAARFCERLELPLLGVCVVPVVLLSSTGCVLLGLCRLMLHRCAPGCPLGSGSPIGFKGSVHSLAVPILQSLRTLSDVWQLRKEWVPPGLSQQNVGSECQSYSDPSAIGYLRCSLAGNAFHLVLEVSEGLSRSCSGNSCSATSQPHVAGSLLSLLCSNASGFA